MGVQSGEGSCKTEGSDAWYQAVAVGHVGDEDRLIQGRSGGREDGEKQMDPRWTKELKSIGCSEWRRRKRRRS